MTGSVLAVLIGSLALIAGLLLMLLPLVASELARPRDSFWAAVVLLLGLVLVTASDRLTGAPMLGVLCGGLLIGRLGSEVGQQRWGALEPAQQQRFSETSYWSEQLQQLRGAAAKLLAAGGIVASWLQERLKKPEVNKRWVRADAMPKPQPPKLSQPHQSPAPIPIAATKLPRSAPKSFPSPSQKQSQNPNQSWSPSLRSSQPPSSRWRLRPPAPSRLRRKQSLKSQLSPNPSLRSRSKPKQRSSLSPTPLRTAQRRTPAATSYPPWRLKCWIQRPRLSNLSPL